MMNREFPHLDGNEYPGVGDSLYPTHDNNFDYDRWTAGTRLYPMTVRWTMESEDRVWWSDDATRDAWFDRRKREAFDLPSAMDILPGGTVKLPIPMQAITRANYLVAELPDMPGEGEQLDHSTPHTKRWHYFLEDARRVTPSVTECTLTVDWFTTFQHAMQVARIDLERGHYPMTLTNVADYLADPLAHTDGMTGVEPFQPTTARRTTKTSMIPLGTGEAYAVLAVKTTADRADNTIPDAQIITGEAPGYASTGDYWGADWRVTGYRYGGARDLANSQAPRTPMAMTNDGLRPNGYILLALKATDLDSAVKIWETHPLVLRMIAACMIVPADMLTLGETISFGGVTCKTAVTVRDKRLADIKLTRDDFKYPTRYARITKLYTSPYATLELTDENGGITTLRIEDTTATTGIRRFLTLAYPTLRALTFLTDINGTGDINITWGTMTGTATTGIPNGVAALATHDVATYTLWLDPVESWNLDNHATATVQARDNAVNSYHTTVRGANTGQTNANASADTGQANANASADTGNANTHRANATAISNTKIQTDNASAVTARNNQLMLDTKDLAKTKLTNDYKANNTKVVNDALADTSYAASLTNADVDNNAMAAVGSIVSGAAATAIGVGVTIATGGAGVLAAGVIGASAQGAVSAGYSGYSSGLAISKSESILNANIANINGKVGITQTNMKTLTDNAAKNLDDNYATQSAAAVNIQDMRNTAITSTTANSTGTANANADANAATAKANAARTATTAKANAQRSRDNTVSAAQIALTQAQSQYDATLSDLRRAAPLQLAAPSGDAAPDMLGTRGVQVRVKTQAPDVIRRCGDQMLRYGYTYNCVVENPDITLGRKFTYWQGSPLVYSTGMAPAQAVEAVRAMFEAGVTIWADGDTIGASIYDAEA